MLRARLPCLIVLCLALIHGTLYLTLVPPWDHYDEPTHLEYAWLIANRLRLPRPGDVDLAYRREVVASMLEHGFQHDHALQPELLPGSKPLEIGLSELVHPPLYYLLLALPLRLLRYADVLTQLYLARGISLLLYVASIAIGCGLVGELLPAGSPLRWAVPAAVALLPGYADLMTAVNNDVGAVVLFSLFLWGATRAIVHRGAGWRNALNLVWSTLAALGCALTKNTAAVAPALLPLVWILALIRAPLSRSATHPRRTWIAAGVGVAALLAAGLATAWLLFSWGDAAAWYRYSVQPAPTSQRTAQAPVGRRALALEAGNGELVQHVTPEDVHALRGETVTLGAWIWSTQPVEIDGPKLGDGGDRTTRAKVHVGDSPAFYTITTTISADAPYIRVQLDAAPGSSDGGPVVYYDGLVLAQGDRSAGGTRAGGTRAGGTPEVDDRGGQTGTWAGRPFANHLRNGSAERTIPFVRPGVNRLLQRYTRRSPSQFLTSILDGQQSAPVYRAALSSLLQTFWARFGWNHISLPTLWYWLLAGFTIAGLAGAVGGYLSLWRPVGLVADPGLADEAGERRRGLRRAVSFLGLAGLLVWANAVLRVHPLGIHTFVPAARYAYPAILPTALALVGGWWVITGQRRRWLRPTLLAALALFALVSLLTLVAHHRQRTLPPSLGFALLGLCFLAGFGCSQTDEGERRAQSLARQAGQALQQWWRKEDRQKLLATVALVLILIAALAARMLHSYRGLPYLYDWDEPQTAHTALQMLKSGEYNPRFFNYGSLLIYANLAVDALHYLYKLAQPLEVDTLRGMAQLEVGPWGTWPATGTYRWYISHPSFYLWNRWLNALLGVVSVAAVFWLARRIKGWWAGVLAALLLAGSLYCVTYLSTLVLVDGPAVTFLLLACVLATLYLDQRRPATLIGSSIAVGLSASIKYNSVYGLVVPFLALLIARLSDGHRPRWWLWPAIPAASAFAFLLGTPYALLELPTFLQSVGYEVYHYAVLGHDAYLQTTLPGQPHLVTQLARLIVNVGLVGCALALVGLPVMARHKVGWILLALAAASLLLLTRAVVGFQRNFAILYPIVAVAVGCGAAWLGETLFSWMRPRPWSRLARAITLLAVVTVSAIYLGRTVRHSLRVRNTPDTRTQAIQEVNALAQELGLTQELGLDQGRVGIASELQVHPLDLRTLDTELLYQLLPAKELLCQPAAFDLIVAPRNDGSPITEQANQILTQDHVPHVILGDLRPLPKVDPIREPGVLVAAPQESDLPAACASIEIEDRVKERPPAPPIGMWEAPISDRHRPQEPLPSWQAPPTCAGAQSFLIQEDSLAEYSVMQNQGEKMRHYLRGTVESEICTLTPGTYRLRWGARAPWNDRNRALLQLTVLEHRPDRPPKVLRERVLAGRNYWVESYEMVRVTRRTPVSLRVQWINGPGYPTQPPGPEANPLNDTLYLRPRIYVEPHYSLTIGEAIATAWQRLVAQITGR